MMECMDYTSISVHQFTVNAINIEDMGLIDDNRVIKWVADVDNIENSRYKFHYYNLYNEIKAYYKGDIEDDKDYRESVLNEYFDSDDFPCCFNIACYCWCK